MGAVLMGENSAKDPTLDGIFHHEICCQAPDYGPCICRDLLHAEIASMREQAIQKEESARVAVDSAYAAFSNSLEEQKRLRSELVMWKRNSAEHEQELEAHATDRVNQRAELEAMRTLGLEYEADNDSLCSELKWERERAEAAERRLLAVVDNGWEVSHELPCLDPDCGCGHKTHIFTVIDAKGQDIIYDTTLEAAIDAAIARSCGSE